MSYRTLVLTKYEIEFGNQIGSSYGQGEIEEALSKLQEVGFFEFYSEDGEFETMKRLDVYEDYKDVYEKFLEDKDSYINDFNITKGECEVLEQIYKEFKMEPRPKYLDCYGCLKFMSL